MTTVLVSKILLSSSAQLFTKNYQFVAEKAKGTLIIPGWKSSPCWALTFEGNCLKKIKSEMLVLKKKIFFFRKKNTCYLAFSEFH